MFLMCLVDKNMAGLTGFEPVMTGSEPVALPLGDSPI